MNVFDDRGDLVDHVLQEAVDDWIPIDTLLWYAREEAEQFGEDFHRTAVELLKFLLKEGLMEIGDLGGSGFEAWPSPLDETVRRFVDGCDAVDWEPQGALWWLAITPKGAQRVR